MPLTRLDMVSMAPKTQEAGNLRQNEMTHTSNLQSNVAGTVQQQARAKETQTVKSQKTENEEQKYDASKDGRGSAYNSEKRKREEKEKEEKAETHRVLSGSTFDITI